MGGRREDKSGCSKFHVLHRKYFTTFYATLSPKNFYKIPKVWKLGRRNFNILSFIGFLWTIQKDWLLKTKLGGAAKNLSFCILPNSIHVFISTQEMSLFFFVNYLSSGCTAIKLGCTAILFPLLLSSFLFWYIFYRGVETLLIFSSDFCGLRSFETHMVSPSKSSVPVVAPALARLSAVLCLRIVIRAGLASSSLPEYWGSIRL